MIKKSPIKAPFFFDTPKGVDHVTKTVIENSSEKLTPIEIADINKLNRDTKLSLLKSEEQSLKKFMNEDPSTYPSNPEQRGKLMNIQALEKSLNIRPDSWKRFVKTGALPLAKKEPDLWKDVIYPSMSPQEKGTWNAEKRKEKLQKQKEETEEKKQKRIFNHTKQQWGLNKKENDGVKYVGSRQHLYSETPAQDALKNVIKGDTETKEPKSMPGVQSILRIDLPSQSVTPVSPPKDTQSLNQRLSNTKVTPGLSTELVKLQKQIRKNVDYVLGTEDQKDISESRNNETTNKEETYD